MITDYQLYFGPGRQPLNALKIWEGGLGVWGPSRLASRRLPGGTASQNRFSGST